MRNFWKLKIDIIKNIVIGVLVLIIFISNFSLITQFLDKLNPLTNYQKRLNKAAEDLKRAEQQLGEIAKNLKHAEQQKIILKFDRIRLENAGNILLAIQDFYFQKNTFPESLEDLKKGGYLNPDDKLADPATNQPYFYQKREQDFIICVWLSDMLKGVNTVDCPSLK